jgi:hypothetical protein
MAWAGVYHCEVGGVEVGLSFFAPGHRQIDALAMHDGICKKTQGPPLVSQLSDAVASLRTAVARRGAQTDKDGQRKVPLWDVRRRRYTGGALRVLQYVTCKTWRQEGRGRVNGAELVQVFEAK